jgi:hypothetical protein
MLDKRIQHAAGKYAAHGTAFYNQCAGGCVFVHDRHLIDKSEKKSGKENVRAVRPTILTTNRGWPSQ